MDEFFVEKKELPTRIYEYLLNQISNNQLNVGDKLPSEDKLAESLHTSRLSLRTALQRLELEGYILRRRGYGTFIISTRALNVHGIFKRIYSQSNIITSRGKKPGTKDLQVFESIADEVISEKLNIPVGESVMVINRIRTADDKPFCIDSNYFSKKTLTMDVNPESIGESIIDFVEKKCGIKIAFALSNFTPAVSDEEKSKKLEIPINSALFFIQQVHCQVDSTPIYYSKAWFPEGSLVLNYIVQNEN